MTQYGRKAAVRVGKPGARGREWTDLRLKLAVSAGDGTQPNRLKAELFNLSDDSVAFLQKPGLAVQLFAGYGDVELLGTGELTRCETTWAGPDRVTTLECADGRSAHTARTNISRSGKLSAKGLIEDIAKGMGVPDVNLSFVDDLELPDGFAFSGKASEAMSGLTKSIGADWHIERGGLVILPRQKPTDRKAVLLTSSTGLIGSPQRTKDGVKVQCLLNPRIRTRSIIRVESREIDGFYMVKTYTHTADTHSNAWTTNIEAIRLKDA